MKFYGTEYGTIKYRNAKSKERLESIAEITHYEKGALSTAQADLEPGDILTYYGHTNVYIGKNSKGVKMWYDAGRGSTADIAENSKFVRFKRTTNDIGIYVSNIIRLKFSSNSDDDLGSITTNGVVQYYQDDYGNVSYGDSNIASCGCGPTAFAMVASTLSKKKITPETAVKWCGNNYYVGGIGTSWSYFEAAKSHFNLNCKIRETTSIDEVEKALKAGNLVISSQNAGLFTNSGHFIVLAGINSSGGITVKDPNKNNAVNKGYNNRTFSKSEINQSAANYWIFEK